MGPSTHLPLASRRQHNPAPYAFHAVVVALLVVSAHVVSAYPKRDGPPPPLDGDTLRKRGHHGAKQEGAALISGSFYNKHFRYASLGFTGTYTDPKWDLEPTVDWTERMPAALTVAKDQGACSACWIFAPVSALEALYAIVYNVAPPNISEQKAIDCQGTWACEGGRPDDAFDYMGNSGGLPTADAYPYTAVANRSSCIPRRMRKLLSVDTSERISSDELPSSTFSLTRSHAAASASVSRSLSSALHRSLLNLKVGVKSVAPSLPPSPFSLSMFESVGISGWLGLTLAVQKQPVVVYISANSDSFKTYRGGYVFNDPACFADGSLDHLVVVVGFNLLADTPYWIVRNSWGGEWGDHGYMKIAMAGGTGICGMNVMPGLYPVLATPDPCGPINPCGSGACIPVNNKNQRNKCVCPPNFIAVTNNDKTQTCTVAKRCALFSENPCGFGTCVDDNKGGYSCLCSSGYKVGQLTNGDTTCVPGAPVTRVTLPASLSCGQVRSTYQLSKKEFEALNPRLKCGLLAAGTAINVRSAAGPATGCVTPYTVKPGDTCASISSFFNLSPADLSTINPDLECSALSPGQLVCLQAGTPQPQQCTNYYTVNLGDTCADVMVNTEPPISALQLYQNNPGLICPDDPASQTFSSKQVCVEAGVVGLSCPAGKYSVIRGDTCASLACKLYGCSTAKMSRCNGGWVCTSSSLYVGRVLCRC